MKHLKRNRADVRGRPGRSGSLRRRWPRAGYLLESLESRLLLSAVPPAVSGLSAVGEGEALEGTSRLSGFVYLDANGNGLRETDEDGVPGALITLSGSDTGGEPINRTAITLNDGFYEFDGLPEGTFEIIETQPRALVDGPESTSIPNAITEDDRFSEIVLGSDQTFTDNDFAESRLLPQYLSIAWFLASSSSGDVFREMVALGEEQAGNQDLAASIRAGERRLPDGTNGVPVANADSYTIGQDEILEESAATGVLANDSDADDQTLTATLVNGTSNGELDLRSDGSFTYTPDAGFVGTDQFSYTAHDLVSASNPATVTITVGEVDINNPPVALDESYEVDQGSVLEVDVSSGVLNNDGDEDGDPLTSVLVSGPSSGQLNLNDDGSFTYTPDANFTGTDSFSYQADDGELASDVATVTITVIEVNQPPIATGDEYTVDEDGTLQVDAATGVLTNDRDEEGDPLSAELVSPTSGGSLTLDADGSFVYTPDANFNGTDTFSYTASDGTLSSDVTTVTIMVLAVNDEPLTVADTYEIDEDTQLIVDASSGLLANDTDADDDPLTAALVDSPANGSVTLNADGSFTYTPDANYFGPDEFTYTASDGLSTSPATSVMINVAPLNDDPPVSLDDDYNMAVDGVLLVDASGGVLANDTDADGDALSATLVAGPSGGTLTLNDDGSFRYTPDPGFHDLDSFTYVASDGKETGDESTVTILVNSPPVGLDDAYQVDEDNALDVAAAEGLLANDSDVDGDSLTAAVLNDPLHGTVTVDSDGSFSYVPDPDFAGIDSFRYAINDGFVDSAPIHVGILVNPVNDLPVAEDDLFIVPINVELVVEAAEGVLANDSDVDRDALSASVKSGPLQGTLTLNEDGSLSYMPDLHFHGIDSFTYEASDGTGSTEAMVSIEVNTPPTALEGTVETNEDGVFSLPAPGVLINGDIDGDEMTISLIQSVTNGVLMLSEDGSFDYTPDPDFHGTDEFTYVLNDGFRDSEEATLVIIVHPVNDPPEAVDDAYELEEDSFLDQESASGVLANDVDAEGDPLTVRLGAQTTAHGSLMLNPDGSFFYAPDADYHGPDSFTYITNDGVNDSGEATVTITVTSVNDLPVAGDDTYSVDEDNDLEVDASSGVLANDTDVDATQLIPQVVQMPTNGSLTLLDEGSFVYSPDANFHGVDAFTYVVNDGFVDSEEATVTITVNSVNDLPMPGEDHYTLDADSILDIGATSGILANDVDEDDQLTVDTSDIRGPFFGQLAIRRDGSFSYTPSPGFGGTDFFQYQATDGKVTSELTTATLTVLTDKPLPQAVDDSFEVAKNGSLIIEVASGLLANDTDPEGDALDPIIVSLPTHGSLVIDDDMTERSYLYTPSPGFSGTDTFTYRVADASTASTAATVTITVVDEETGEGELTPLASLVDLVFADEGWVDR